MDGHASVFTTGIEPDNVEEWSLSIDGAYEVSIGPKQYRCLQATWANAKGKKPSAAQYYVADSGRTVFFRRYNGPTHPGYEDLYGHPEIEYQSITWRHWYDSIPDIALIRHCLIRFCILQNMQSLILSAYNENPTS